MSKNKKVWVAFMLVVSFLVSVYFCFSIWNEGKQIEDGVLVNGNESYVVEGMMEDQNR